MQIIHLKILEIHPSEKLWENKNFLPNNTWWPINIVDLLQTALQKEFSEPGKYWLPRPFFNSF